MAKLDPDKFRRLSARDLADIEQRFAHRQTRAVAEGAAQSRARRRVVRRILCWFAVLLAVACYISATRRRPLPKTPTPPPTEPIAMLGDAARRPAGLTEMQARLADFEFLAAGSQLAADTQIDYARRNLLPVEVANTVGIKMRLIPPGTFLMGSPESETGRSIDEPVHVRAIQAPIYMGTTEITQGQWNAVMTPQTNPSWYKSSGTAYPVEEVTWDMCVEFCEQLCKVEGLPAGTYRLPDEHEWEYACRAGTQTRFCCGDSWRTLRRFADFKESNARGTSAVGRRRPNAWGLHDMHGNVWEWCGDRFYEYQRPTVIDRQKRSIRGGHWHLTANDCRAASRYRLPPDSHGNVCGFRIVRELADVDNLEGLAAPEP
ncbi:MAG: formylglycine-generating enzyme family protein [Lentisphaeria bacterium]|jgi:formylglycine-generating enzyme required for sulfatase activity|nr:formylglycine-generating enzyme family protein [Lentisphaeria bacterium]